ncbi:hypothetical protein CBR_g521 [Chara braunii]|uniref:Protein kinase domain-containing protein n=1 Tax=Chara braunii TaxID=69332 RepID=A0A388KBE6_CHABU|nr:hypothetical protein CBR_g521 [Chara braunii]|eukprot:GBG67384.1 hypothetical protein CBR_g521 [Chara braunii]
MAGDDSSDGNGVQELYDEVEDGDVVVPQMHSEAGSPNICCTHVDNGRHASTGSTVFLFPKCMTVIQLAKQKAVLACFCLLTMMALDCFNTCTISAVAMVVDREVIRSRVEPTSSHGPQLVERQVSHDSADDVGVGSRPEQRTVREQSLGLGVTFSILNNALVKRSQLVVHIEPEAPFRDDPNTGRICSSYIFSIQVWEDEDGAVSLYYGVSESCDHGSDGTDKVVRMSERKADIRSVGEHLSIADELITYWFPVSGPDGPRVSYPVSYNYTNISRTPMYMFTPFEISELGSYDPEGKVKSRVTVVSTTMGNRSTVLTDSGQLMSLASNPARTKLYITDETPVSAVTPPKIRLLSANTTDDDTLIDNSTIFKMDDHFTDDAGVRSISSVHFLRQSSFADGSCVYFTDRKFPRVWSIIAPDVPKVNPTHPSRLVPVAGSGRETTFDGSVPDVSFRQLRDVVTTAEGCHLFVTEDGPPGNVRWIKLSTPCARADTVETIFRSDASGFWGLALHDDGVDLYLYVGTSDGDIIELQLNRSLLLSCANVPPPSSSPPPVYNRRHNDHMIAIAAAAVSATILFLLLLMAIVVVYIWRGKKQVQSERPLRSTESQETRSSSHVDVDMSEGLPEASNCGSGEEIHPSQLTLFSLQDLEQCTDNFSSSHKVGETGAFGRVYRGVVDGMEVAMKVMIGKLTDMKRRQFLAEINTLSRVHHANLIQLIGYCHSSDRAILVYPYFPGGSLHARLHERVVDASTQLLYAPLTLLERIRVASQIAKGLSYLHEDFGLAAIGEIVFGTTHEVFVQTSHVAGTYGYMSPEYFLEGFLTDRNDVYAFGVIRLELLTGRRVVMPSPSGTGAETLVSWVKRFLGDPSVDLPHAILDVALCKGYPMEVNSLGDVVVKITYLAMECVEDDDNLSCDGVCGR